MVYRTGTIWGEEARLELLDVNGDSHLDLVSIDDTYSTPRTLEIRFGIGDGTLGPARYWGTSEGIGQLAFVISITMVTSTSVSMVAPAKKRSQLSWDVVLD